jgi:MYXO-CTERM domain-containing protein
MVLSSLMVATVAGQALAADPQILRNTHTMADQLPMYNVENLSTARGGGGGFDGLLNDSDVNQGVIGWNFDGNFNFVTAAFLETLPDLSPINGGVVFGGTSLASGGSVLQETTHSYLGFDATNNYHVHSMTFTVEDNSGTGFVPAGVTLSGIPINYLSQDMGTGNLGGNGMVFNGDILGYFSASMDVYIGGGLATTDDFFTSSLSFAGTQSENTNNPKVTANSVIMQGFNPPAGPDIAGFNIDKLVIRGTIAVAAVPTPGAVALFGLAGLAGVRRRR